MGSPVAEGTRTVRAQTSLTASVKFIDWLGRLSDATGKPRQALLAEGVTEWAKARGLEPAPPRMG